MTQEEVIKKVVEVFESRNIPYMLTGGIAVDYYGRPRFTHDVDIVLQIKIDEAQELVGIFGQEFYIALEGIIDAIEHRSMFNLIHLETGFKVDCWILKDEDYAIAAFNRRRKELIFDRQIYISAPEDLIISKLGWYKQSDVQKHYDDILGIFQIQAGKLDLGYIRKWAEKLSFIRTVEEIVKRCS